MQTPDPKSPVFPQDSTEEDESRSPGIDQLIQKAENENSEQVKLIETERQKYAALLRQLEEKSQSIEELEKSTKQLDDEAKQLHKQFKENREICESLKRTNGVLQEHEEALLKKREMARAKLQQVRLENQSSLTKFRSTWEKYKEYYESTECAKELTKIKSDAMDSLQQLASVRTAIQHLEGEILRLEEEKNGIEDSLQKGITSAIPTIIKLAQLNLETNSTAKYVQEVASKIIHSKEEQQKLQNWNCTDQPNADTTSPIQVNEHLSDSLDEPRCQQTVHNKQILESGALDKHERPTYALGQAQTKQHLAQCQPVLHPIQIQSEPHIQRESTVHPGDGALEQQRQTLPPVALFSHRSNEKSFFQLGLSIGGIQMPEMLNRKEVCDAPTSQPTSTAVTSSPPITAASRNNDTANVISFPTTPVVSGSHNLGDVPCMGSSTSPFNFEMHTDMVKNLTKSPGDGFLFQSRPMFDSAKDTQLEQPSDNAHFSFNLQESRNAQKPTEPCGEFFKAGQSSMLFGPLQSKENNTRSFGRSLSPFTDCSIFGESDPQPHKSPQFSFSFGARSPHSEKQNQERSATFSLF